MIQFACPGCQKRYKVGDEYAGKKTKCKQCEQVMRIPTPAAAAVDDEVGAAQEPAFPEGPTSSQAPADGGDAGGVFDGLQADGLQAGGGQTPAPNPLLSDQPLPSGETFAARSPMISASLPQTDIETLSATTADLSYEISQRPDFSIVKIHLREGKKILAEPSAMASMTPNVKLEAGFKGGLGKTLGRMLGGESLIINTFTAENGDAEILFAGGAAGDVAYQRMEGQTIYLQRGAYMLNTEGVEVTGKWQGAKGFFGGEGLVLLKASGVGDLFFNSYGAILEVDVTDGFIVDSGYIVAFEESLDYNVTVLPGLRAGGKIKSFFFGGEGLVCQFSGRGRVWVQTRHVQSFLSWANGFRPTKSN